MKIPNEIWHFTVSTQSKSRLKTTSTKKICVPRPAESETQTLSVAPPLREKCLNLDMNRSEAYMSNVCKLSK